MRLYDVIHAPTRPAWTARLVVYLALMVTISVVLQLAGWFWFWL